MADSILATEGNARVPHDRAGLLNDVDCAEIDGQEPKPLNPVDLSRFISTGESAQLEPSKEGPGNDPATTEDSHELARQNAEENLSTSQLGILIRNGSSPRDSDSFVDSTASSPGPVARFASTRRKSSVIGNSRQATRIDEIISWASKNGQNGGGISGGLKFGKESKAPLSGGNGDDIEAVLRHLQEIRARKRKSNGGKCNGPSSTGKASNVSDAFEIIVSSMHSGLAAASVGFRCTNDRATSRALYSSACSLCLMEWRDNAADANSKFL